MEDIPFILMADSVLPRQYQILADWQPGQEYRLNIDSLGFKVFMDFTQTKWKIR